MATDAWHETRTAVVALWRRLRPGRAEDVGAELDSARARVMAARELGDEAAEEALAGIWRRRFQQLLDGDAAAAIEVRGLVTQHLTPMLARREQLKIESLLMSATANAGGQVIQAHSVYLAPPSGPASTAAMRTLPRDVTGFAGRDSELEKLLATDTGAALAIHAVDGMPGVGKTALVTRAAHLLAERYPDGQLFVQLHAHTPGQRPADPGDVLAALLAATGMTASEIPENVDRRAERWRDRLAGKKVLLVLDDAADHAQVEPLLPGAAGCLVLITSRRRLIAFDGAEPLPLRILPAQEAVGLFLRLARRAAQSEDTAAVAEIVRLCGYLPLAIAILAGRLAHHPAWRIAQLADDFAAAHDRLAELDTGERAVAAAFELSYRNLPASHQRGFRRMGLHPGLDIDAFAASALNDIPLTQARRELEGLYSDNLVDEPMPGRYQPHDLIRSYARRLVSDDPADEREAAIGRLFDFYQHTAETVDRHLDHSSRPGTPSAGEAPCAAPDLAEPARAMNWMRTERGNILACADQAAAVGRHAHTVRLAAAMATFLHQEGPWPQTVALHQHAIMAARSIGDLPSEATALFNLGRVRRVTGQYDAAVDLLEQSYALYVRLGETRGQAFTLNELGRVRRITSDHAPAADLHERALTLYRSLDDRRGEAYSLNELGRVKRFGDDYRAAAAFHENALAIFHDLRLRLSEATALDDLGRVRRLTGDYKAAAELHESASAIFQDLGRRQGYANALNNLGRVRCLTGDRQAARDLHERALSIYRHLGDRLGEANARNDLGRVNRLDGDLQAAAAQIGSALAIYQGFGTHPALANGLDNLGRLRMQAGDIADATKLLEKATAIYRDFGSLLGEAEVLNSTGTLLLQASKPRQALACFRQALRLARRIHTPLEEARALEGTARCKVLLDETSGALADLGEAVGIFQRINAAEAGSAAAHLKTVCG